MFGKTAIIAEVKEKFSRKSRNMSFRRGLAFDFWDFIPNEPQAEENSLQPKKRVLSHAQVYHMLKDVDPEIVEGVVSKKNLILFNCFPVTPNCHRITEFGNHMVFDKYTRAYRKLIDYRGPANELSTRVLDCLKLSKIWVEKSSVENPVKYESASTMSGMKYIKELLLGKRSDHAFRMVVVGDPNIKLGEIGLPCHIAESMQISEYLNKWNYDKLSTCCDLRILEKGETFVRRKNGLARVSFKDKLQTGDIVYRPLEDGDIVLINRPPSIHPHSLIALSVKILPINSVLSINPLICSPFRGDFDGDCLHGYVPQSMDSIVELRELVGLNKQLINGQSGRNLLSLSHDSLTAAHLILEDGVLLDRFKMQQLQMFCPRNSQNPALIKANLNSGFWTGKQLFSLLLPPNFNYEFPMDNVCISRGELLSSSSGSSWLQNNNENLFYSLVKNGGEEVLDFLFAAQEVLCEWLSMRGLSVSLKDLYLSSDSYSRKNMIDEVTCGLREAERISHIKLLMVDLNRDFLMGSFEERESDMGLLEVEHLSYEKQKSAALSRAAVSAFKKVFWDIQTLAYQYANKDNSFMTMLKAGSKGNLVKMVQHGMCVGLQHSLVPLSFKIPHKLTCAAWNYQKMVMPLDKAESYIPYGVVESSFLTGLNPLECFVHSLTNRDSSFGGHADISGTLTRRLMFFMRDLYIGYDGTVRNPYGNQLIQFSYNTESNVQGGSLDYSADNFGMGGQPVGPLAACALSEAAYSALDQPISALQSSPLLNLKKILECGVKKVSGDKTASIYLSKKLGRWFHGFEYGALEVKNHLERVLLSEIVSTVAIFFSPQTCSSTPISPWVCHFHISKEIYDRKRLKLRSIIDALYTKCNSTGGKQKTNPLNLQLTSNECSEADKAKEHDATICITVATVYRYKDSHEQLEELRETVIPFLLGTVIKGSANVKKVDILWKDTTPNLSRSRKSSSGELYLQVFMSETCDRKEFWRLVMNDCLKIWDVIDWERSHPDLIQDITSALGIDVARNHFLSSLKSTISDTGKTILPEHLLLTADCLSFTGEFVALSAKGLSQQRKHTSVSAPFVQACFSNPGDCFIKAAKAVTVDNLQGSVDALTWGKVPSIGTGGRFDILYSGKGHELAKPEDIYNLLGNHMSSQEQSVKVKVAYEHNHTSSKDLAQRLSTHGDFEDKGHKHIEVSKAIRRLISSDDIRRLSQALRHILHKYTINDLLTEVDKSIAMTALYFHPRRNEKIGTGAREIKVGYHSEHGDSRCFILVRTDGTVEDFSYHKCVYHALELIDPGRAKGYQSRWLKGKT
ncbi:hypothetical protein LguiA_034256 [Lonicera macranthoides]